MEVFSQLMEEAAQSDFIFHPCCAELRLPHLCFADDLLVFVMGKLEVAQCVKRVLNNFSDLSGLTPNPAKSTLYCSGFPAVLKDQIKGVCIWRRVDCL